MFYKVEDGFYINADKITTIEFLDKDYADISFSGNGFDEAIPCELAKQIMDDIGCNGFNPFEIREEENEETDSRDDGEFYVASISGEADNVEQENEETESVNVEKTLTFLEYARHAYALGFRYATPLFTNWKEPFTTVFWTKKPVFNEDEKCWELSDGQAVTVPTTLRLVGLVDLQGYLFSEEELYV